MGLIVRLLCARLTQAYLVVPLYLLLGLIVRTLATAILIGPGDAFTGLTPGSQMGLPLAAGGLAIAIALPATARLLLAALALMAGAILVNPAPPNPYSAAALAVWRQGHFLNFNGLTRWVATLWPFLTLPFLILGSAASKLARVGSGGGRRAPRRQPQCRPERGGSGRTPDRPRPQPAQRKRPGKPRC